MIVLLDNLEMNKVIITGITGFVGKAVSKYLQEHKNVVEGISLRNGYLEKNTIITDTLIHLVGKAHDLKNVIVPKEYYDVNTKLTEKVFDAFLNSEATTFITLSSVKAVADSLNDSLTEQTVPHPLTHYGRSKLLAEEYIMRNLPQNKRVYILRPCMIHGAGNKGNLNLLYKFVKKGIPYPLAAFENKRSFLSVENLCFIIRELIERDDIPSGIYNVSDDVALSTNRVVEILSQSVGKSVRLWKVPKKAILFFAILGDVLKLPFGKERLSKLTENYVVSNTKIKTAINKPLPLSAEQGLLITAKSFQDA